MNQPKIINSPGKKVHDYIFVKELGKGAFGQVFSAKNSITQEIVAIKCVPRSKLTEHNGIVGQLLNNEVSVLQQIDHPNVVRLITYMESLNQCYIVLEYCNSGDFEQLWKQRNKRIPENEAMDFMKQILGGMQALHEKNVLHRDLKLANILIHNGTLKIADLGFCKQMTHKDAQESLSLGSLGNMAPEVVQQRPYGMAADMFSIGSIFYQLLFGEFPFTITSSAAFLQDITNRPPDFRRGGVQISRELQDLLSQMLKKDPRDRIKWSELYAHKLIVQKKDLRYEQLSINKINANQINPEALKQFYGNKEESNMIQILQQDVVPAQQPRVQQIQEVFENQPPQDFEAIRKNEEQMQRQILKEKEVNRIAQEYMGLRNQIVYLSRTLNEIQNIQHKEIIEALFPAFMISKKINNLSQRLINQILSRENIFQISAEYLEEVYKNKYFDQFQQLVFSEQEYFQYMFSFNLEQAKKYQQDLAKKLPNAAWLIELSEDPSRQFTSIFTETLQNYFFLLQELRTKLQQGNQQEYDKVLNLLIHLVDVILYDKILNKVYYIIISLKLTWSGNSKRLHRVEQMKSLDYWKKRRNN